MSKSLTNPEFEEWFEEWCTEWFEQHGILTDTRGGPLSDLRSPEEILRNRLARIDWRFLPFVSFKESEPTYVKVFDRKDGSETKGVLVWFCQPGSLGASIQLRNKRNRSGIPVTPTMEVRRYRHCRSKRWRSPKEQHEAQVAYYLLKFK